MTGPGWALITGASRRLGQVLAISAAQAGFDVIAHGRSVDDASVTAEQVRAQGREARVAAGDLCDPATCAKLIADAPSPPTLLVNCASLFEDDAIETLDAARWDATLMTNLRAPVLLAQAFAAALPAPAMGLIVNIIDQRVWRLNPRFFSYTISKSALWTATRTMAQALAPRIRVNAIGPGPTLASIHQSPDVFTAEAAGVPLAHAVEPREIGEALKYLISASSVTGQMIAVDAGQHLAWRTPDVVIP